METDASPSRIRGSTTSTIQPNHSSDWNRANVGPLESRGQQAGDFPTEVDLQRYSMQHGYLGSAIIFNIEDFEHMSTRTGTERDKQNLVSCFRKLGFSVNVKQNYSAEQIKEEIRKVASADHSKADCFVCVFQTHGDDGVVFGSNSHNDKLHTLVRLQEDVFDQFRGEHCKSLIGKPKIFIIQACRGESYESGVIEADNITTTDAVRSGPDIEEGSTPTIPSGADFLICYSTSKGFFSFRNRENGSWYISALCEQLGRFATREEFTKILTRVHRQVSLRSSHSSIPSASRKKQMPCFISMLTKQLFITPTSLHTAKSGSRAIERTTHLQ